MAKTVYIINKSGHDFSDAERFGSLVYLSTGTIDRYGINKMYRKFAETLKNSSPDDYILVTGLTIMSCIACSVFSFLHGRVNLLLYKDSHYIERRLLIGELLKRRDDFETL